MYVINASVPDHSAKIYEPTRIIVGCAEQAIAINAMLQAAGIEGEVTEVEGVPVRTPKEQLRAQRLMALLFVPSAGTA